MFLFDRAEMAARHGRILAELSKLGAELARKGHAQGMETGTPEETAAMTAALHRIPRSVRQTLALELRLKRELDRCAREAQRRTDHRNARLRAAVERLIWTEYDGDEVLVLTHDLSERLSEEALSESFPNDPSISRSPASAKPWACLHPLIPAKAGTQAEPQPSSRRTLHPPHGSPPSRGRAERTSLPTPPDHPWT